MGEINESLSGEGALEETRKGDSDETSMILNEGVAEMEGLEEVVRRKGR